MRTDIIALEAAIAACREAQPNIRDHGGFRAQTLLDMLLIELDRSRAEASKPDREVGGRGVKRLGQSLRRLSA